MSQLEGNYEGTDVTPSPVNLTRCGEVSEGQSLAWLITVPLIVGVIIIVTVVGNGFVMLAYWRDRRIHGRVANLLIFNLAVSDFIVGLVVLSVNLAWITWNGILGEDAWLLGETFCKLWLVIDYTATTVSVLTIILISLDRYWLLSKKLRYQSFQTRRRVTCTLVVIWIATAVIYAVVAFAWVPLTGLSAVDFAEECELDMSFNIYATTVQLFLEFVIPLWLIGVLNVIVYVKIKQRAKGLKELVGNERSVPRVNNSLSGKEDRIDPEVKSSTCGTSVLTASDISILIKTSSSLRDSESERESTFSNESGKRTGQTRAVQAPTRQRARKDVYVSKSKTARREFRRHRRSAMVLAVIVTVFIACWLPYQIINVINALCGGECVSYLAWEVVNNILWCNSFINPFLYAATNVHFKRNFITFLGLDRGDRMNAAMREASRPSNTK